MAETNDENGLNLLCIDGGGARGMSSLVILGALMDKLQKAGSLSHTPKPFDCFDMMAGTGTGGIEVVLLGRLKKSVDEAKVCYSRLASEVFSDKKILTSGSAFKSSKLEKTLKSIIEESTGDANERMLDLSLSEKCKVFVCAMSKHRMNAGIPCLMRTYVAPEHQMPDCTIWEALRATTAHPELFKSIDIGESNVRESFVDGGLGCNNPVSQLLLEAKLMFPGRHVSSIISIGSGHTRTIQIPKPSLFQRILPVNALIALKDIATDCERAAQAISRRFQNVPGVYFRFNVDQGLQNVGLGEWERLGEVTAHTRAYLRLVETGQRLDSAAEAINFRKSSVATAEIDGQVSAPAKHTFTGVKDCPPPTPVFTGREKEINRINSYFFDGTSKRRIFVLHGLGGAGKTQVALRFVETTQDRFTDIIYVDATSRETISASLQGFAISKNLGKSPDDSTQWLATREEGWLLIFNNADSPEIDLRDYFPKGSHGNILITTRNRDLGFLACGDSATCEISGMESEEALQLLLKTARMQEDILSLEEKEAASKLVKEFGYLALAIIQAGAYIWRLNCSPSLYLELYHKRRQALLEEYRTMPLKVDDYQKTVYTTWLMSFERLGPRAVDTLQLLAFLHNDSILEDMFRRAAASIVDYIPAMPLDDKETKIHEWLKEFLSPFTIDEDLWDSQTFLATMVEIMCYSLISYDRLNRTYSIHPLVHLWARTTVPDPAIALERTARLLALSVDWYRDTDAHGFRQTLGPHVDEIFQQQSQPNINNVIRYATVYEETGRLKQTEKLYQRALDEITRALGANSPGALAASANLARTYSDLGHWEQSANMLSVVLEQMKRTLGEEDPATLLSMCNLASTYKSLGRLSEAEALQLQVFEIVQNLTVPAHAHLLFICMNNLGEIYLAQGRWEDAEEMQTEVLKVRKETYGEEHPQTLDNMGDLATIYAMQHRWKEAGELQTKVYREHLRTLGEAHPKTLTAMHSLADTYSSIGEHKLAENFQNRVLAASQELLGEKHPDTLSTMASIASTLCAQEQWVEAESLFQKVYAGRKAVLGDNHPHTLSSMNNLAAAYAKLDRNEEARDLQVEVLEIRQRLLGEEHPDTLTTANILASVYLNLKDYDKAETLQLQVLDARKRVLGAEHPSTLTSMNNLAAIYYAQDRLKEFVEYESQYMEATKRARGAADLNVLASTSQLISVHLKLGVLPEAEALQLQQLQAFNELFGTTNPNTVECMRELAAIYELQGRQSDSDELTSLVSMLESLSTSDSE